MKGSTYKRCKCRGVDGKELASRCPRLRQEDGAWNPRHGAWYFYLELGAGPGGRRRRLRRGGFTTQEDAENALEDARCRALRGLDPGVRYTVGQYLDEWLAGHGGLRRSTRKSYGEHIEYRDRCRQWQTAYERELAAERASGRTVNAFKIWVSLPRPSRVMVWTPEPTGTFLDHAADHPLYPLLHLMAFRGLRRGEACGLACTYTSVLPEVAREAAEAAAALVPRKIPAQGARPPVLPASSQGEEE